MKRLSGIILCFHFIQGLLAQTTGIEILRYQLPDEGAYIDVCIEIPANEMKIELIDSVWHSSAEIAVILEQDGETFLVRKTHLTGPETKDSTEAWSSTHIHIERIKLDPGNYITTVLIGGLDSEIRENVLIPVSGTPMISDIMLVEAYTKSITGEENKFSRSGLNLVPLVDTRISPLANRVKFYAELYNIDQVVGQDSLFLIKFGFTGSDGRLSPNHTRYLRLKAGVVTPVFETLPIDGSVPPTDGGILKIEISTKDGHLITSLDYPVSRWSATDAIANEVPLLNFAAQWNDVHKLYRHLEDHLPIATPSQQNTILNTFKNSDDLDMMRGFLEYFWISRNPENPLKAWQNYSHEVMVVDSVYGNCRSNHGADTDQGYVYLKYGRPNTVVQRLNGTDYYPYEIWHYHHTLGLSNRRVLFYAPHVVAECLEILQSDLPGEIRNEDWIEILKSRENRLRVTETQLNRLNPKDTFSREEPEDLYYNPR
ncbi:MAG: hypothetical protein COA49_04740 [Bacteroidetes bacterium]|nr:MAG: hypothetical protein COA49_04740 [Bacteroidota bacterium]